MNYWKYCVCIHQKYFKASPDVVYIGISFKEWSFKTTNWRKKKLSSWSLKAKEDPSFDIARHRSCRLCLCSVGPREREGLKILRGVQGSSRLFTFFLPLQKFEIMIIQKFVETGKPYMSKQLNLSFPEGASLPGLSFHRVVKCWNGTANEYRNGSLRWTF